jgi:pimeloyl-ACP methyl ester carboxylesterase
MVPYQYRSGGKLMSSLILDRRRFGTASEIPAFVMRPQDRPEAPVVLYQHGYTGKKENDLGILVGLAERGYRILSLDASLHGERRPGDFAERFERDFAGTFRQVVVDTVADISRVLDELGVAEAGFIGVSMGAYIAYQTLVTEPRLTTVVPFIGSPGWEATLPERISELEQTLRERSRRSAGGQPSLPALLIMNGERDELVPPIGAQRLHDALLPLYSSTPERLEFHLDPSLGHGVTEAMWRTAFEWMSRYLPPAG